MNRVSQTSGAPALQRIDRGGRVADATPVPGDGYAGSTEALPERLQPDSRPRRPVRHGGLAVALLAGFTAVGSALSYGAASAAEPDTVQPAVVATVSTATAPQQNADQIWLNTFSAAFQARTLRNPEAFMKTVSPNGVDVRGLDGNSMTHLSKDDLAKDLKDQGAFYQKAFSKQSSSQRFVIAPDSTGLVGTILLN